MERRIRKARIISTTDGREYPVFVLNEEEGEYEVLLIGEEEGFTLLRFCKKTMVERHGKHLLYIPQEDL